ncbi:MAG: phosphoribosylamine--glycine ligase [Chloroflexaceae bacterium]|nr:phosphoribosylamine--glycine ligase [Chloroflexaceae bacterium]
MTRDQLKVLVVGGGGREHALAWGLAQSPRIEHIYVAPGNAGTQWPAAEGRATTTTVAITTDDIPGMLSFARNNAIDLTVVGPEMPLVHGIVDTFQLAGLPVFGPSKVVSQLEGSKAFAKDFMQQHGIPTAEYATFTDYEAARQYLIEKGRNVAPNPYPVVVKADGLAAGKGVIVCANAAEGVTALHNIMVERLFGAAGDCVVLEERLSGPEVSVLAFCDGVHAVALPPARDYKRAFDGDHGPNTGGMGAYAPVAEVDDALLHQIEQTILQPTIAALAAQGTPYVGVLYAGIMLTSNGPKVLEFNCRFGDPEAQAVIPLLDNLLDVILACVEGHLTPELVQVRPGVCATVVLASAGYPGSYSTGEVLSGLEQVPADVMVFHAGTALQGRDVVTSGGRVLAVSGYGNDLNEALRCAYAAVDCIAFRGMHFRRDIGQNLK